MERLETIAEVVMTDEMAWLTAAAAKLLQSCLNLCNPIDGSPPGSTILGILQARTLEWVAISFSRDDQIKHQEAHTPRRLTPRED